MPTRTLRGMSGGAIALAALLCACAPRIPQPDPADVQAARQAALGLDIRIRTEILSRIERDEDPIAVYVAYRDTVPAMTREAEQAAGFELSRVALRVRNPTNTPDDWENQQLLGFQFMMEAGFDPETLETSAIVTEEGEDGKKHRVFRWMRPLGTGETCMVCHGDDIEPRILALLSQDFTEDEATGYYANELRGAYSVRKPLD